MEGVKAVHDWEALLATSYYHTAQAIRQALAEGHAEEAQHGLACLIQDMEMDRRKAVLSQIERLMHHIFKCKWYTGAPHKSWLNSIDDARNEIADHCAIQPSITPKLMETTMWEKAHYRALRKAQRDLNMVRDAPPLTWEEVFNVEYDPSHRPLMD